jgi:probable phosphoglycerate mutase
MRHGQSEANQQGIIVSDPGKGTAGYGLTATGKQQAHASASSWHAAPDDVHIYSSDFLRARQTAGLVHAALQPACVVTLTTLLRERWFGQLDGQSDQAYASVWSRDAVDPQHTEWGVESVAAVADRATELLQELEQRHHGETILLVAHGDVLQIMQTLFAGVAPSQHRQLPHLQVAEIRCLG